MQPIVDSGGRNAEGELEVFIAIMGITGAGKSHFIREMSKDPNVKVSSSQFSCKYKKST
jgi:signal recognition particle receptor subunit beta